MRSVLKFIFLAVVICIRFTGLLYSQPVRMGDLVPDGELKHVFNYSEPALRISEFRGKLVILDFWDVSCISCIEAFPKMDSLQKLLNDRIQIILVNRQSEDSTRRFFSRLKKLKLPNLPFVTSDSVLNSFFPHKGEPFHVWIDGNGIAQYKLAGYNTTYDHISYFLNENRISFSPYIESTFVESLFDKNFAGSLAYYSYISHCRNGLQIRPSKVDGAVQFFISCASAVQLYKVAFTGLSKCDFSRAGRLVLNLPDSFKYTRPKNANIYDKWAAKYSYNYHLFVPETRREDVYKIMKSDLDRYFNLEVRVEKVKVKCMILVRTSGKDKLHTKGGIPEDRFYQSYMKSTRLDSIRYLKDEPFERFIKHFSFFVEKAFSKPFVDATGYKGNIDIEMTGKTIESMDMSDLRGELRKYDLDLVIGDYPVKVLVINKKNH